MPVSEFLCEQKYIILSIRMKYTAANIITIGRIILSVFLLFCPVLSPIFYVTYLLAGISDMADGAIARRTGTVSGAGARLDTAADFIFLAVCFARLLPVLHIPIWIYVWTGVIFFGRAAVIVYGYVFYKRLILLHTAADKAAGFLLFVMPLTLKIIDLKYSLPVVCTAASAAAAEELYCILRKRRGNGY